MNSTNAKHAFYLLPDNSYLFPAVLPLLVMEQLFPHFIVLSFIFLYILFQSPPTVGFLREAHSPSPIRLKTSQPKDNGLRFNGGGSFKVALFADLHFGEDAWTDWGPQQDVNSIKVMSTVLDLETPGKMMLCIVDRKLSSMSENFKWSSNSVLTSS